MVITKKPNWYLALGLPAIVFLICYLLTFSAKFVTANSVLSKAILGDLLLTAPLLYFLAIRKTTIPKISVIRVFFLGLLFAGIILGARSNEVMHLLKTWVSPILELVVTATIIRKFYIARKKAKEANENEPDFLLQCRMILFRFLGHEKIANLFASEVSVFYYAFRGGRNRTADYKTTFSNYKENGLPLVLYTILGLFLVETAGTHFLISTWSRSGAWVITTLSAYTCLQLFAHIRAIKARPVLIKEHSFEIHNGLAGDAVIPFHLVDKIELSGKTPLCENLVKMALLKGLEGHNVVVHLKQTIVVTKVFGIKKKADVVLFFVDERNKFFKELNEKMQEVAISESI